MDVPAISVAAVSLGHVDGVRIGRTGGDIGNAARVDLSVGIGATDEDGG